MDNGIAGLSISLASILMDDQSRHVVGLECQYEWSADYQRPANRAHGDESHYEESGNDPALEIHPAAFTGTNGIEYRPISVDFTYTNANGHLNQSNVSFNSQNVVFADTSSTNTYLQMVANGGTVGAGAYIYLEGTTTFRSNTNNVPVSSQYNAANSAWIALPYYDNHNTLNVNGPIYELGSVAPINGPFTNTAHILEIVGTPPSGGSGFWVYNVSATTGDFYPYEAQGSATGNFSDEIYNGDTTDATANARLHLRTGGTSAGDPFIYFDINGGQAFSEGIDNSDGHKFKIAGSGALGTNDYLTINASGQVGIGTTSPDMLLSVGSATPVGNVAHFENSTGSCYINPTTTSLSCSSDLRLKDNINALATSSGIATLMQLNPVTYNWTTEPATTSPHTGFIAQQVLPIIPDLVSQGPDGYYTLNYAGFTTYLVKAVQEIASISGVFEQNLIAWLGSASNGIDQFFANVGNFHTVNTTQLCVGTTCVTPAQFQAMVSAYRSGQSGSQNAGSGAPTSGSTSGSSASGAASTPPLIQLNGVNPVTIDVGATYNDLGATITGPQADLNLGIQTYLNGTLESPIELDTSAAATDTIDYVATDGQGLTSTSTRTVIVEPAAEPSTSPPSASSTDATSTAATSSGQ